VNPQETIGKSLTHYGVYDLVLTETLWRLISPGFRVVDIGANIGYFSLLMAHRVGPYGVVHCFEPHPVLQKKWQSHLRRWPQCLLYPVALTSKNGEVDLHIPSDFSKNEGIASLEKIENATSIKVPAKTLDSVLGGQKIDLIKIDVEGHEMDVFKGAEVVIKTVENIIFEDFQGSKSPVIQFFRERGLTVYRLKKGLTRVHLMDVEEADQLPLWEPPNYIATHNPSDIKNRLSSSGWKSLKGLSFYQE
jgi:FkbM family methyltransferase